MADCVGVPTGRVDMLAFGLGSGIAGLAGVALSQLGNAGPDLGRGYIVDSFMAGALGGVGQAGRHSHRRARPKQHNKFGAYAERSWPRSPSWCSSCWCRSGRRPCLPARPERRMKQTALTDLNLLARRPLFSGRAWTALGAGVLLLALAPLLNLAFPAGHPLHVSAYAVALGGKLMCYAMAAALALDLVWAMPASCRWATACSSRWAATPTACERMRHRPRRRLPEQPAGFHGVPGLEGLPWYWSFTDYFWYAMLLVMLVPGLLALVFGYFAFACASRAFISPSSAWSGVLTFAAMLLFFRNDTGFGGNNGFTDFKRILRHHRARQPALRCTGSRWRRWPARWCWRAPSPSPSWAGC